MQRAEPASDVTWNYRLLLLDGSFFYIGSAFIDSATVMPLFVSTLTSSPLVIGMVTTIRSAGHLLPQVFIAGIAQGLSRKKPLLVGGAVVSRICVLALALTAGVLTARLPGAALGAFFLALSLLALSDGISGVPWTDILARTIPLERRGRLLGTMQCVGGVGGVAAGWVIRELMVNPVPGYPLNYAAIFSLGFLFLSLSLAATCLLREPPGQATPVALGRYLKSLPQALRAHPRFRRLMVARAMMSMYMLALPFYIVHSRLELGFGPGAVGAFVSAQMAGSIIGGMLWGNLADRCGNRRLLQVMAVAQLFMPVFALISRPLVGDTPGVLVFLLHLFIFAILGACFGGGMWMAFTSYLLEIVDDRSRPTYIGLMNTLSTPLGILPVAGGLLVRHTSYPVLFAVTACLVAGGIASAWRLPEPRCQLARLPGLSTRPWEADAQAPTSSEAG
jgi:MFS family permease